MRVTRPPISGLPEISSHQCPNRASPIWVRAGRNLRARSDRKFRGGVREGAEGAGAFLLATSSRPRILFKPWRRMTRQDRPLAFLTQGRRGDGWFHAIAGLVKPMGAA